MALNEIKTRFAPSPSGQLSLGNGKTAVFSYCYAKKNNAPFILRVEDTNAEKSTTESLINIMEGLTWLGVKWDQGPTIEEVKQGVFSRQHFQSQRSPIYEYFIKKLIEEDKAYLNHDGCVMFRMPQKPWILDDLILGHIEFPDNQEDFIIARADGSAIFHLANVVDDALSGCNPLSKGCDHLNSYPKHAALFEAIGFPVPEYAHMTLVLDEAGQKLSKRRSDQYANISDFKRDGLLPEAVINLIGTLSWKHPEGREGFDLVEMCKHFDLKQCTRSNPRYSKSKLLAINSKRMQGFSKDELSKRAIEYGQQFYPNILQGLIQQDLFDRHISCCVGGSRNLKEVFEGSEYLYDKNVQINPNDIDLWFKTKDDFAILDIVKVVLEDLIWTRENIMVAIRGFCKDNNLKMDKVCQMIRLATTFKLISPPIDVVLFTLDKLESLTRINSFIEKLDRYSYSKAKVGIYA